MEIYDKLLKGGKSLSVIGLGYVGLPIALEFARKTSVIGFDIKEGRIAMMRQGIDPSQELEASEFEGCDIRFTSNADDLSAAGFHIIAVPTPIDEGHRPDLKPLLSATRTVGKILSKGDYVVYESTVYPGATEEDCIPILEQLSGLKYMQDFKVGYSPERINPGDKEHKLSNIVKVVSACDEEALDEIAKVYEMVVEAGVFRASSIKVAEAAKIIENTQRDVNIALMNELSMIFNKMNINTFEVLKAAGTKWNFLNFTPGLVGGHCIGVDPYYLTYKAERLGFHPRIINSGRCVNDSMGAYIAKQCVKKLTKMGKNALDSKVLIMGVTFKEGVSDIRNSRVPDIMEELLSYGLKVELTDPYASSEEYLQEYGYPLIQQTGDNYDAIIVAVAHEDYKSLDEKYFRSLGSDDVILIDVKGLFHKKIETLNYWSL